MPTKLKDLVVKTGEYRDRDGNTKARWMNVGALMQSDDGGMFIMLDRAFNPAGIPNPDNRSNVLVSCFDRREQGGQSSGHQGGSQGVSQGVSEGGSGWPMHDPLEADEIPF